MLQQSVADLLHLLKNNNKINIPQIMYGDAIRNAISEIANILKQNKAPQIKNHAKELRVLPTNIKKDSEETRVENKKIHIPKLPSMETFLKQYRDKTKHEKLHHIFEQDKKLSIDNLLKGPTKTTWQKGLKMN